MQLPKLSRNLRAHVHDIARLKRPRRGDKLLNVAAHDRRGSGRRRRLRALRPQEPGDHGHDHGYRDRLGAIAPQPCQNPAQATAEQEVLAKQL